MVSRDLCGQWGLYVVNGDCVWSVGTVCGQWGLCVVSGDCVWSVGTVCGQ